MLCVPPVARNIGVVVGRDDFLDGILLDHDFVVCQQSSILEVLTLVVFELPCGWVEKVREDLRVLSVIFHPIVENSVYQGYETSNDVGVRDDGSVELFRFSVFVHLTQDVCDDVRLPWDVVNGKIEFLKSVQPPDLAVGRLVHGLEILQCGSVGIDNDWQSVQIMSPFGGRFHECQ